MDRYTRQLYHQKGNSVTTGTGEPSGAEGSNGSITVRDINGQIKLFAKYENTWHGTDLGPTLTIGDTHLKHITLGAEGLRIKDGDTSIASFTDEGVLNIKAAANDGNLGFLLENDGQGYNQQVFKGANPEIWMGYTGSGASMSGTDITADTGSINGSSKIFMNRSIDNNLSQIVFATAGVSNFGLGGSESEFRINKRGISDVDIRQEGHSAVRIDADGNIGFRGEAPAAAPNYTGTTQNARNADTASTIGDLQDVVRTLIADLISMGLLT